MCEDVSPTKEVFENQKVGKWPSGQWQQTVNLSPRGYGGSNPSLPTIFKFYNINDLPIFLIVSY